MFLVFEGIDGSGKSTQTKLLAGHLRRERGLEVLSVREPGGTEFGEKLRRLLLEPVAGEDLAPVTEAFLFMAARSHLVQMKILPALEAGRVVISDRFIWSTAVYQGTAAGIPPREIFRMGRLAAPGVAPAKVFLIDLPPEAAFARVADRNRMEERGIGFQRRVREGFLTLARRHPRQAAVIDGRGDPEEVHARVLARLPARGWPACSSR